VLLREYYYKLILFQKCRVPGQKGPWMAADEAVLRRQFNIELHLPDMKIEHFREREEFHQWIQERGVDEKQFINKMRWIKRKIENNK